MSNFAIDESYKDSRIDSIGAGMDMAKPGTPVQRRRHHPQEYISDRCLRDYYIRPVVEKIFPAREQSKIRDDTQNCRLFIIAVKNKLRV